MLSWLFNFPSKFLKYPGLHYGAPKLKYAPEDQVNKPVILIFGWLGASERHLAKYTKLYQDKGYETIHYIPPTTLLLFPHKIPEMNEQIQGDLVRIMKENDLLRRPFLLHLFSSSGYINWCYFQRYLKKNVANNPFNIYYKVQGTVMDSTPCTLDAKVMARGFLGATFPHVHNHHHWFLTPVYEAFFRQFIRAKSAELTTTNNLISNTIVPFPQWYLYSSGDTMLYKTDIDKHIKRIERKTKLLVTTHDFVTSNHVAHFRTHPIEYSKRVDSILYRVEAQWAILMDALADFSKSAPPPQGPRRASRKLAKRIYKKPSL